MSSDKKKLPFDPSRFAMPSTGAEEFGTRKIRSVIPVNKPGKMEWVHWSFLEEAQKHEAWPVPHCPTLIIHGKRDETVPIEGSRAMASTHDQISLVEVNDDHSLSTSITLIEHAVDGFLLHQKPVDRVVAELNAQQHP